MNIHKRLKAARQSNLLLLNLYGRADWVFLFTWTPFVLLWASRVNNRNSFRGQNHCTSDEQRQVIYNRGSLLDVGEGQRDRELFPGFGPAAFLGIPPPESPRALEEPAFPGGALH